jgi:hypothetical protein
MNKDNKIRVLPNNKPGENDKPLMTESEINEAFTMYAKMQWEYFNTLKLEGFNDDQALKLIAGYHPLRPSDR